MRPPALRRHQEERRRRRGALGLRVGWRVSGVRTRVVVRRRLAPGFVERPALKKPSPRADVRQAQLHLQTGHRRAELRGARTAGSGRYRMAVMVRFMAACSSKRSWSPRRPCLANRGRIGSGPAAQVEHARRLHSNSSPDPDSAIPLRCRRTLRVTRCWLA